MSKPSRGYGICGHVTPMRQLELSNGSGICYAIGLPLLTMTIIYAKTHA